MEIIKFEDAMKAANSDKCKVTEYSFDKKDIDFGIATITGRYPEKGYCMNLISEELIYVMDGNGILNFENKNIPFKKRRCNLNKF